MSQQDLSSRRRTERITVELSLEFSILDGTGKPTHDTKYSGVTLDVSLHGMSFVANHIEDEVMPELVDGLHSLAIAAFLPNGSETVTIAKIAWANKFENESGGKYFIGVEFPEETPETRALVAAAKPQDS